MNQIEAMRIYVRVAEVSSFTQAAESLGLLKASVSTTIKQLEAQLGTRLLHRTTRSVQMTQDGLIFYERSKDMLADMEELQSLFQHGEAEISGRLRVDLPNQIAKNIIIPRLPEFLKLHPKLEMELSSTDRRVDVVREGFDCVMRVGNLVDSALIARPLGHLHQINCASPEYLALYGTPKTLEDLAHHKLIYYANNFGGKPSGFEYQVGQQHKIQNKVQEMAGSITVNNSDTFQAACLAGFGIIQAPEISLRNLIEQGKLVAILGEYLAEPMPISLLYANRRHLPKRTQRFMHWLGEIMRQHGVDNII
jgi:DNA-binding transcriptional LysR family regulator